MNVIFILCDTLPRHKLSPYHQHEGEYGHIRTPTIERFAERAATFTNHWISSAPCMPARRDLWSGRIEFPWRSWGPRESFDPDWTLALRDTNVTTALFTDHANLFDVGAGNYHYWFDRYELVRGHFNDRCETVSPVAPGRQGDNRRIYQRHRQRWQDESSSYVARNMQNVSAWLDEHHDSSEPFFLFVDEFDPHWPLDPPEPYRSMYLEDESLAGKGLSTFYHSPRAEDYSEEELAWLNAQCAGKITLVDRWLGEIFERLDRYDLWDDTMVILTTDHGEFIGEYGQMSKGNGFSYPLFSHIPLFIHLPGAARVGERLNALTSTVDLHATVLDALQQPVSHHSHSRSLLPLLRGTADTVRDDLLYGWWGKGFYWTDGHRLLCKAPVPEGLPLYQYGTDLGEKCVGLSNSNFDRYAGAELGAFLPHTDRPVYRVPMDGMAYGGVDADFDALFDLDTDPGCNVNLYDTDLHLRQECLQQVRATMRAHAVPDEQFLRLGLISAQSPIASPQSPEVQT